MNVKRKELANGSLRWTDCEKLRGRDEERDEASESQDMVAGNSYIVNKIIMRLRSNEAASGNG